MLGIPAIGLALIGAALSTLSPRPADLWYLGGVITGALAVMALVIDSRETR